ncbi:MAG TPA: GGDEF domain-containing phosphodiesterase, partial [Erysipelotrichaceae bacterium]|nr:GGDEF domain-containing phosphodiesterase [Erysipelotrichaceae bacterium]
SEVFIIGGQKFLVSASAGIAVFPSDGKNSDELVKNADIAMYKAKEKGINHFAISSQLIRDEFETVVELTNNLAKAIENDEFTLHYQPQVDINTSEIVGVEALLRWNHPTLGLVSPNIFIPIAEKNNLINDIGSWVLKTACLQNKLWQNMGLKPLIMAVNISASQILNNDLVSEVKYVLKETGLSPKYLELEVTESIAIRDSVNVLKNLRQLSYLGVSIAIDDFGMEYSSLSRLKQLPTNMLKIDMDFTKGIETNLSDRAIIRVIISLAKNLNIKVIAEGVETKEQLEFLKFEKCDFIQGYLFYKPLLPSSLEKHLVRK